MFLELGRNKIFYY